MSKKGIDVSEHQGEILWDKVKSQIDFAILRFGWIGNKENHTIDKQFMKNYLECKRLKIPIGIYIYNYCKSENSVTSGANWVLSLLESNNIELDLPIYIDMEDDTLKELGKDKLTDIVIKFNTILEEKEHWTGVYSNLDWYKNYLHGSSLKNRFTYWIAHYGIKENEYEKEFDMHQFTSKGIIDGINDSSVDLNIMHRDLIEEIKNDKIINNIENLPNLKSNEEIMQEVINGKWGNGEERKQKLIEAGYNYNEIQKLVNEKIKKENTRYHIVKSGETLTSIANKYNTTWIKIYNANKDKINDPNLIKVNWKLIIP